MGPSSVGSLSRVALLTRSILHTEETVSASFTDPPFLAFLDFLAFSIENFLLFLNALLSFSGFQTLNRKKNRCQCKGSFFFASSKSGM